MKAFILASSAALALAACTISEDPADGGFLSGIVGLAGGGYQNRIDALEAQLAADQAEANALASEQLRLQASSANNAAQLRNLRAQLAALQAVVRDQVATLEARGVPVNSALKARVQAVSAISPTGNSDAARLASLRGAIADARALSADLARLS
jgi:chromosome segregation ATPase